MIWRGSRYCVSDFVLNSAEWRSAEIHSLCLSCYSACGCDEVNFLPSSWFWVCVENCWKHRDVFVIADPCWQSEGFFVPHHFSTRRRLGVLRIWKGTHPGQLTWGISHTVRARAQPIKLGRGGRHGGCLRRWCLSSKMPFNTLQSTVFWKWLSIFLTMWSSEWISCFALLVHMAFTYLPIKLTLSQTTNSLLFIIFIFSPILPEECEQVAIWDLVLGWVEPNTYLNIPASNTCVVHQVFMTSWRSEPLY